jgi:hypothetical protein
LATKVALGKKITPLVGFKADKSSFPKCFHEVKPFLVGNEKDKRIGLTITKLYSSVILPVNPNITSITDGPKGEQNLGRK